MKACENANAKINLFLDIESLRADGYHNIISYMQSITLHDIITVEYNHQDDKSIAVFCDNESLPCDKSNLVYKAADIYPVSSGRFEIQIEKKIPMSAGLAGGSADAAATLIAINRLLDNKLSLDELKTLGARIGADVPFCIEKGSCLATGTGDILTRTAPMPAYPILVARIGDGMSTPQAYRLLDSNNNNFKDYVPHNDLLSMLTSGTNTDINKYVSGLYNIFESVVEPLRPDVTSIKKLMTTHGAVKSMMSGSGTSVFGIFENENDAKKAEKELLSLGAFACICYPYNIG